MNDFKVKNKYKRDSKECKFILSLSLELERIENAFVDKNHSFVEDFVFK